MTVLSDSSPLITLAKIKRLELLPQLYRTVTITPAVLAEVVVGGAGLAGASEISEAPWINVRPVRQPAHLAHQHDALGLGELSIVALGRELHADLLLMDDMKARNLAKQEGLAILGCVGVLYDAFVLKLLPDLTVAYRQVLSSGAYVDRGLLENILKALGLPSL